MIQEADLHSAQVDAEQAALQQQSETLERHRADIKYKLAQIAEEIQALGSSAQEHAQLSVFKKEMQDKEASIQEILRSRHDAFIAALSFVPSNERMDEELAKVLRCPECSAEWMINV